MPTVRTIPAIPGNVKVAPISDITAVINTKLKINAKFAAIPNNLYLISIKIKTRINPIITELSPFVIFS